MFKEKAQIMDAKSMGRAIARITYEIIERNHGVANLASWASNPGEGNRPSDC